MELYVQATINSGTAYFDFVGQTRDQITTNLTGIGATNITFIDEDTYNAAIQALQPN
jgi:hypothetical protein